MDPDLLTAIGRVTVTGAHLEMSMLRVLASLTGMPLASVIAFVGRMHAEPLIDTTERMVKNPTGGIRPCLLLGGSP